MLTLDITPAELQSGQMTPDYLDAAVRAIITDGFVVLNDVIDPAHIAALRTRMLADLNDLLARADAPFNWNRANIQQDPPPHALIVNVPVVDMSAENGSTELWPGTHLDTRIIVQDGDIEVPDSWVEARRAKVPPIQPAVRSGGILIRDGRLWHRGMPNHTDAPRPMIAMIHVIRWWSQAPIRFPKGTEGFFEHPDLATSAVIVDDLDHIQHNRAYKFAT